jgi:hypothetical protein
MTTYSQTDLATRMLKDLGLIDAEEVPSAADLDWAIETVGSEVLLLAALNMPIWNGNVMAVPEVYLTSLSRRCGLAVAPSFGLTDVSSAEIAMREAERSLAILAAPRGANPRTLRADHSLQRFIR